MKKKKQWWTKLKNKINQERDKKIAIKIMSIKLDTKIKWNKILKRKIKKKSI
jgi:hypothetical protein